MASCNGGPELPVIPEVGYTDDLSSLSILDEDTILEELGVRFQDGVYYTFIGEILVAINPYRPVLIYNDQFHEWYSDKGANQKPHIFWTAQQVHRILVDSRKDQCILVNGESGAGKTESTKLIVRHLVHLSSGQNNQLHEKIVCVNPLLESFGNAATVINENSSRFGKFIELNFNTSGRLQRASITEYMLEKSRIVSRGRHDRNFHIFYYLLAGLTEDQKLIYCLQDASKYRILKSSDVEAEVWTKREFKSYKKAFSEQMEIMRIVGFSEEAIITVVTILAAILHLTNVQFFEEPDTNSVKIQNEASLRIFSGLLGLKSNELSLALTTTAATVRGEQLRCLKNRVQAENGRDALAKALYAGLFKWIVAQINMHLKEDEMLISSGPTIGILDMAGFENLHKNGFEQLCINAANERLQQFFVEMLFEQEARDYKNEDICIDEIHFENNNLTVDLLFQKPTGLFHIIDEESMFPGSSDSTLKDKLDQICSESHLYIHTPGNTSSFTINHYAGKVTYDVDGMLERNRDNLNKTLVDCISNCENEFVKTMASSSELEAGTLRSQDKIKVCGLTEIKTSIDNETGKDDTKASKRRLQRRSQSIGNLHGGEVRQSNYMSRHFRRSLSELMHKMSDSKPWFVRCMKPNSKREPDIFDIDLVRNQLRYNGLLQVSELRRDGYAIRMFPEEFIHRYRDITFSPEVQVNPTFENCERILLESGIQGYAFGKRQVFLRHWHRPILQDLVSEKRKMMATEQNSALSENGATDLDTTYDLVAESQIHDLPFDAIAIEASPIEEITIETAITTADPNTPKRTGSCTSSSSRQRVTEWIQQNEQLTTDVKIPPYDPAPPPVFSTQQGTQKQNHVRINLPMEKKLLDTRLWDRFQMIPRERVSTSDTFRPFLRAFKFFCYVMLFCIVLGAAVVNKLCILLMTSSIVKDEKAKDESQSPANMMLIISICFPYCFWVLSYSAKSLFGSSAWPSFKVLVVTLFLELLHSFGLCLLVFHILPKMDMARGLLNICGIFTVPAFLKTICIGGDRSLPGIKRFTLTVINGIAFLIQFSNLAATTMFSIPLTEVEKSDLQNEVIDNDDLLNSVERPHLVFGNRLMWEIPVSLFLISLSYWENFVDSDISICTFKIPLLEWKKHLHTVRQRLYIFAGIWKIGWTMVFAVLLLPGFNFNMEYSDTKTSIEQFSTARPPVASVIPVDNSDSRPILTTPMIPLPSVIPTSKSSIPESKTTRSLSSPYRGSKHNAIVKRSTGIADAIQKGGVNAVLNLTENTLPKTATIDTARDNKQQENKLPGQAENKTKEKDTATATGFIYIEIPESVKVNFQRYGPLYAQILASAILSYFGSLACKLCMQTYGFTIPLFLTTPITLGIVVAQCYTDFLPSKLFIWMCPEMDGDIRLFHLLWLGVLWISQIIVTIHIWSPRNGRMAKIERLFVTPLRCGVLTDLSLMLRRRLNDRDFSLFNIEDDWSTVYDDEEETHRADDVVPQIYACATMWHETRSEMTQLLKSLFRMDTDHSARYLAQRFYGIRDPDYYEFEAHIFFDDAMDLSEDDVLVPNSFVAELIDCIDDAISSVHERQMQLGPPVRTPTPYGGRLTWRLPGATKLVVHLKDKHKIRHKKRWSQVMYMYYLLGYRILAQPENLLHREANRGDSTIDSADTQRVKLTDSQLRHRRQASHFTRSVIFNYTTEEVHTQAENTFILTLDGDVDFKPDAVRLLVDRLKKNKKVGAACGRIHPVGSGPIMWYQEFEYAIGHWLQKATEHVFGCVLCAPGCFSLFRGSALMDDNVARCYAIRASEAGHYVQYDQGEDRWLSTLLLQQGYRIDYCAAADALTHAPETFSEFFNQRRRWGPSTLANIVDLLGDWKNTVRLNDNISTPYILYQFFLLVSTILGPATVLLMMAGAFTVVFKTTVIESYAISLLPAIAFIIVCIYTKPSTQITVATILSAIYAIIMTIVLVGTVGTAIQGSLTSPNVVFLMILVIIFFIAALMHPEEFTCVIPGALYFICIPTGYLILTIYYLSNMHIVSWGTREVPKRKSREQILAEKLAEEEKKKKKEQRKGMLGWLGLDSIINETVEIFRQLRTMTITKTESKSKTDDLLEELIYELRQTRDLKAPPRHRSSSTMTTEAKEEIKPASNEITNTEALPKEHTDAVPVWLQNEDPENPGWLGDNICGDGPIRHLEHRENVFWKQLIRKYVNPINEDKVHQEKVAADLKNLRNNVVFGFFMTSALWIALTMQLQLLQDEFKDTALFIKIPHFDSSKKELTFEPLGMIFLGLFSAILFFQFIGMLSHRWGTILHVLSITDVSCSQKFTEKNKIREVISKAMELQRVSNIENEPEPDYDDPLPDYDDETGEDEDETLSTLYTDSSSSIVSFSKPPSYHSHDGPNKKSTFRRRNSAIFNRRGMATGRTLRRAFERRYRNQLRREKSADSQQNDGETSRYQRKRLSV